MKLQVISTPEYAYYESIYPGKEPIKVISSWHTQATIYDIPDMPTEMMMQFRDDLEAVMRKYDEKTRADNGEVYHNE